MINIRGPDQKLTPKLPRVDLTKEKKKPRTSCWIAASHDVRHALEEYRCSVAVYNKVSSELGKTLFGSLERYLTSLSTETKVLNTSDEPFHGNVGKKKKEITTKKFEQGSSKE